MKRLVLLGAGHAHLAVLRDFAHVRPAEVAITLVTPESHVVYSGMVPGIVAGHYREDETAIDAADLARRARASFVAAHAGAVDPQAREVRCADGRVVAYDVLSVNVGPDVAGLDVPGVRSHAIPVRPFGAFLDAWAQTLEAARSGGVTSITLVGGGAGGVELALAMDHRLRQVMGTDAVHVRVATDAQRIVPEFTAAARRRLQRRLSARNVGVHAGNAVVEVGARHVRVRGGLEFASDRTFWVAGAAAPSWIGAAGFATDERGFLLTDAFLRSVSHPQVFAAGDCATREDAPRPKAGVFAVRAAPALAKNLRAALANTPLAPHVSSARYLALISTGARHAVGTWNGLSWEGDWVWRWKDRVDRAWVEGFQPA